MMALDAALDLIRRLPPSKLENNLADLVDLAPEVQEDLLSAVDQPLQLQRDASGREFLTCDYNRDGDSYRSPWTNEFVPPLRDGVVPSARLRAIEELANSAFDAYRAQYYDSGVSSTYLWDLEHDANFAACVLFRKDAMGISRDARGEGRWDALHVFEVKGGSKGSAVYKLTSTIMLSILTPDAGKMHVAGMITRQSEREEVAGSARQHVINMGKQLEELEIQMRHALVHVYFGKLAEVFSHLRNFESGSGEVKQQHGALQASLAAALSARGGPAE